MHAGARVTFGDRTYHFQVFNLFAMLKSDTIHFTIAPYGHFHPRGERVDNRDAYAVQATGKLIVFTGEFTACVQPAQDQFNGRYALFRMDIDRHTAPVVDHFQ